MRSLCPWVGPFYALTSRAGRFAVPLRRPDRRAPDDANRCPYRRLHRVDEVAGRRRDAPGEYPPTPGSHGKGLRLRSARRSEAREPGTLAVEREHEESVGSIPQRPPDGPRLVL